jgi:hypothetical protein
MNSICPNSAIRLAFDFLFVMNQRISLLAGIHYSNKGNRIKKAYLTDMFGVPYDPEAIKANYSHHYIEVPLKINYNVCFEKFKLYFSGGVIPGFLAGRSTTNIAYTIRTVMWSATQLQQFRMMPRA